MSFDSYREYLNNYLPENPTAQNRLRNDLQNISNMVFDVASNCITVKRMKRRIEESDSLTEPEWINVEARVVKPFYLQRLTVMKDDFVKLIFKDFDYDVLLGDIFEFNNYRWMVVNTDDNLNKPTSVMVQRCNVALKFTESAPLNENIIHIDGISSKYALNQLRDGQFIKLPDNRVEMWVCNDVNGRKIEWTQRGGTRFLISNPYQNWMVISYDNTTLRRKDLDGVEHGIIRLDLELSTINSGLDDLDNGVAWQDYF